MIGKRSLKYALLATFAALPGCAGMGEGPIPVSQGIAPEDQEPDLSRIRQAMRTDCLDLVPIGGTDDEAKRQRRNSLVTAYMTAVDIRYNAYERNLLAFSRQNDLGASLATQLLSAIGAASGSQAISEATNITTGAVSATQSAFSKSLLNQTVSVIQTHMRAQRQMQFALATRHLALPYKDWNSCQALQDALSYEQAGTLNAALAAMAASATDDEREGDRQASAAIQRITYSREAPVAALRTYVGGATAQNDRALAALTDLINRGVIVRPSKTAAAVRGYLGQLMTSGSAAELRALINRIVELEGTSAAATTLRESLPQN
jgi:hypothetical protein